ncbi:MAG: hypothetical protein U0939_05595 [Pirellulales bacterium]
MSPVAVVRRGFPQGQVFASAVLACLLIAASAVPARADVAPPPPPQKQIVPVELRRHAPVPNKEQIAARIVIPRSVLEEALGAAAPTGGTSPTGMVPWGTVLAGVFLAAALASIPFVLRGRRAARPALATAVVALVVFGGWTLTSADVLVPGGKRPERPRPNGPNRQLIQIEVTNEDSNIVQLTVRP